MATVSIIIPCFNKGKYIMETLDSVYRQTYTDWEVILVDDGSTDNETIDTLKNIRHARVALYFNENRGVSFARNFAIAKSHGKFILPLDADDLLAPSFLAETVPLLQNNTNVKVVTCDVALFGKKRGLMLLPEFDFNVLLARNILVVSSLFRRIDYDQTAGYNENMRLGFEDWDFWISLLHTGGEVITIKKPLFSYRIVSQSRNYSIKKDQFAELRKIIYQNHKKVYGDFFVNPTETFEYHLISESAEFKIGRMLLKPIRKILHLISIR